MWSLPTEWRRWRARWRSARSLYWDGEQLLDMASGQRFESFDQWCTLHRGSRCAIRFGAACLNDLLPEPALPLFGGAARLAWARRVLQHYHGDHAAGWPLAAWQHGRGVCALLAGLGAWRETARRHAITIATMQPLWPRLLAGVQQQRPGLKRAAQALVLLVEGGWVSVLTLRAGGVVALHRRRLSGAEELPELLREETELAGEASGVSVTGWLGADAPQLPGVDLLALPLRAEPPRRGGAGSADFLQPLPRPGAAVWALCGAALLVLALTTGDALQAWRAREQAQALALPAPRPAARVTAATTPALRAEQAALQRLDFPWHEVFLASEAAAAAGVVWLGLEYRVAGELRLQGLAPSADNAQHAAQALRGSPRWQPVTLARLEAAKNGQAFDLVAQTAAIPR